MKLRCKPDRRFQQECTLLFQSPKNVFPKKALLEPLKIFIGFLLVYLCGCRRACWTWRLQSVKTSWRERRLVASGWKARWFPSLRLKTSSSCALPGTALIFYRSLSEMQPRFWLLEIQLQIKKKNENSLQEPTKKLEFLMTDSIGS